MGLNCGLQDSDLVAGVVVSELLVCLTVWSVENEVRMSMKVESSKG